MNILLVDDKYDVVEGIAQGVDWASIGEISLYFAYSGKEALEIMEKNSIQLLVTDIEMPGMSGLELAATVRQRDEETGIIFLTSHDSFRYAQSAIRLGCSDYILQPVEYGKLQNSIIGVINQMLLKKLEADGSGDGARAGDNASGQEQAWKEILLHDPPYEPGVMRDILEDAQIYLGVNGSYRIILAALFRQKETLNDWITHQMEKEMCRALRQALPATAYLLADFLVADKRWAMVVEDRGDALAAALEEFQALWTVENSGTLAIYVSGEVAFECLPAAYQELDKRIGDNVGQYGGVFTCQGAAENISDALVVSDSLAVSKWKGWLLDGEEKRIREDIALFLEKEDKIKRLNKRTLVVIAQLIISTLYSFEAGSVEKIMAEPRITDRYVRATDSASDLLAFLDEGILLYREKRAFIQQDSNPDLFKQIKNYISGHLESDLNREKVAERFYISKDYLSHLFAKNEGMGFTQYVNEQRVGKAKELLRNTNLPVKIIALNVGISDYAYFSKMFRKSTGISANEYRLRNQGGK